MIDVNNLTLLEVDHRLSVLRENIESLRMASESLVMEEDHSMMFLSLHQAFHDELRQVERAIESSPDNRYAALESTMVNLATIRQEADSEAIDALDDATANTLKQWNV